MQQRPSPRRALAAPVLAFALLLPSGAGAQEDFRGLAEEHLPRYVFPAGSAERIDITDQGDGKAIIAYEGVLVPLDPASGEMLRIERLRMNAERLEEGRFRLSEVQLPGELHVRVGEKTLGTITMRIERGECEFLIEASACMTSNIAIADLSVEDHEEGVVVAFDSVEFQSDLLVSQDGSYSAPLSGGFRGLLVAERGQPIFEVDSFTIDGSAGGADYAGMIAVNREMQELSRAIMGDPSRQDEVFELLGRNYLSLIGLLDVQGDIKGLRAFLPGAAIELGDLGFAMDWTAQSEDLLDVGLSLSHLLPAERELLAAIAGVPAALLPERTDVTLQIANFPFDDVMAAAGAGEEMGDEFPPFFADAGMEIRVDGTQVSGADYLGSLTGGVVAAGDGFFGQVVGKLRGLERLMELAQQLPPEQQAEVMPVAGVLAGMGRAETAADGTSELVYVFDFDKSGAVSMNGNVLVPGDSAPAAPPEPSSGESGGGEGGTGKSRKN